MRLARTGLEIPSCSYSILLALELKFESVLALNPQVTRSCSRIIYRRFLNFVRTFIAKNIPLARQVLGKIQISGCEI